MVLPLDKRPWLAAPLADADYIAKCGTIAASFSLFLLNNAAKGLRIMHGTTMENRRKELKTLLHQMETYPERDWTAQKKRAGVLREMLTARETARG